MHGVLIAGAGKIGRLIAALLANTDDYDVHLADIHSQPIDLKVTFVTLDATNQEALASYIQKTGIKTVVSCLPYFANGSLAQVAKKYDLNYFDLTEDIRTSEVIQKLAEGASSAFVPQCGLAPGFISIVANDLIKKFEKVDSVLMRVGALPENPNNALKYALTWSTDGLINEYAKPGYAIVNGKKITVQPLEGLESIEIDGLLYEAFNTSGGLGTLAQSYDGKVNRMNYKTLRYPGHCVNMRLLMHDLKLNEDQELLKKILEHALPKTHQDVVIIYVAVNGQQNNEFIEESFVKKVYPKTLSGKLWSAIQITTASSACAVMDIVLQNPSSYKGMVLQESIPLTSFFENRFGQYYL